jgi:uncharacterized membrane protein HdeD (DUF308 family)
VFATMSRMWWILALQGLASIVFGVLAVVWPGITLLTLIYFFGAFVLVDGVFALGMALNRLFEREGHVGGLLLRGLVGIVIGLASFALPGLTALALLLLIAAWAISVGVLEIAAAIRLREEMKGEWAVALAGLISILFGLALIAFPRSGALAVIWTIGIFSIVAGVGRIMAAFRLRTLSKSVTESKSPSYAV